VIRRTTAALLASALLASLLLGATGAGPAAADEAPEPAQRYVVATYELFLGRGPTSDEASRWAATVALGDLRALTRALAASDEWAGSRVDHLYRSVLGRPSEPAGRAHWVDRIAAGHTLEAVAAFLYGSEEYYRLSGSTPDGFVDHVYQGILGRSPDDEGQHYWVGRLAAGATRADVAAGFYASLESRSTRVTTLFHVVLGRAPDRGGHDHWVEQVQHLGDVSLAAFLAASDEQYRRVTGTAPSPPPTRGTGTGYQPLARAGPVELVHPAALVDLVGFHESGHDGGKQQDALPTAIRPRTLPTRYRGTGSRTAADIVVPPGTAVRSPVTGTVKSAGTYVLYCRYRDDKVVIRPDAAPDWEVTVLHITGVQVRAGDRVVAGITPIAPKATPLPFESQVDRQAASPTWPHVHVEVLDPRIPDRPSGGC
jgi:Domain of unknown function (DUF4214)